jgi:hypothetical protein
MIVFALLFWLCVSLLVWTHVAYPLAAKLAARLRPRRIHIDDQYLPRVAVIVVSRTSALSIIHRTGLSSL